jgi:hypothetical protein
MKNKRRRTKALLICVLAVVSLISWFSVRFKNAASAPIFSELCDRPITFGELLHIAIYPPDGYSGNACINNLRQLDGAKQQWALENKKRVNDVVTWRDVTPYIGRGDGYRLWCPQGGVYRLNRLDEAPTCSIAGHQLN